MNELSKGSASPIVYLLTGYFEKNQPVGKLTPLINRILAVEKPSSAVYQQEKPVVLKTNSAGIISTLHSEKLVVRQPFHAHALTLKKVTCYRAAIRRRECINM